SFSIQSLLDDIRALRAAEVEALDPWWLHQGWDEFAPLQNDTVIARVLNEHYRRVQIAYAEVVRATFPRLAGQMGFYSALPLRWEVTVVRRELPRHGATVYYKILPVATWDHGGANVRFSARGGGSVDLDEFQ